jgi:protein gp37
MSDKTAIEWTKSDDGTPGATWNPLRRQTPDGKPDGHYCQKLSPGCDNCYASRLQPRYFGGTEYEAVSTNALNGARAKVASGELYLDAAVLAQPLHWKQARRIFVCSMTDLFGEWVPADWLAQVWAVMAACPQHTFLVLTKRPRPMQEWLLAQAQPLAEPIWLAHHKRPLADQRSPHPAYWRNLATAVQAHPALEGQLMMTFLRHGPAWPVPNVWLGVTVESDTYAWRAKVLAEIPAAVRWVSAEPLLGPLPSLELCDPDCSSCWHRGIAAEQQGGHKRVIDWLVTGGESGHGARPMHPDWARDLRDRCQATGVAYFFKQVGGRTPKAGGRLLDGREWSEYPEVGNATR